MTGPATLRPLHRFGIPALALGRGLSEAGFVLALRAGLGGAESPALLAAVPALVILRFVFQDRGAVLEASAQRDLAASWRTRLLDALGRRAVPAYRPETRRALDRALGEHVPAAAEGVLARRRVLGALLEGAVLLPLLFLLAWKAALAGVAAAVLIWPVLRLRNRRLKALEQAGVAGRGDALRAREDFGNALEALPGAGLAGSLDRLKATLEAAHAPEWRWRRAQARYPAVLETGLFFVLAAVLFTGAVALPGLESLLLFAMLLLLSYRPLREAARQYPLGVSGARAARDLEDLVRSWERSPPRTIPAAHPDGDKLATRGVVFAYEPGAPVLDGVVLELRGDAVTGLTGPNGAGKTTLLRLLSGAETPDAGAVLWSAAARERGVATLTQRAWPGHDWTEWARALRADRPELWRALDDLLGIERIAAKSAHPAAHPESLSGGERQRLALARVLSSDAAYLLLDEPTNALPADERERVLRGALALWTRGGDKKARRGALVVSHEPFLADLCDVVVRAGELVPRAGEA